MPLVVFHTRRVREALKAPTTWTIDLLILVVICALAGALLKYGTQVTAQYQEKTIISLSFWSLPKYTFFSLSRGFAAYALSLVFTLVYGTIAAHNHRAEKIMIPVLDILQAIPVLGFLPGLVLAMVSIFPTRELGLELACIVMIFTGQAWNMVFSFHGSLRGIPSTLREAAKINGLSGWQTFKLLEVPASMIGLVWNSMMSMAGGWFFLTVNEAFTLGNRDFRLPGIGSYMNEAIIQDNIPAMLAAVVAMIVMIVLVDQFFWRPIVVWSQKYKLEDQADADKAQSWVLNLLGKSRMYKAIGRRMKSRKAATPVMADASAAVVERSPGKRAGTSASSGFEALAILGQWCVLGLLAIGAMWGAWALLHLLIALPIHNAESQADWLHVLLALMASFLRTSAAVTLGATLALPVGIIIGLSPKWSQRLQPIIQVVASFPAPMLFPLVTLLLVRLHIPFTIGCVSLMLLGSMWYILFNVIAGATAIPADLKEVSDVYRMSRWEKWRRLYVPCVFPYLVTGLVTAAGGAWNATIVSEFVQVKGSTFIAFGLGSMISKATTAGNFPLLTASVVMMAVFVVLVNRVLWKRMYRLAEARFSLNM